MIIQLGFLILLTTISSSIRAEPLSPTPSPSSSVASSPSPTVLAPAHYICSCNCNAGMMALCATTCTGSTCSDNNYEFEASANENCQTTHKNKTCVGNDCTANGKGTAGKLDCIQNPVAVPR